MSKDKVSVIPERILPKLLRVRLDSLECSRNNKKFDQKLTADVNRKIKVSLEKGEKLENPCRVVIDFEVRGAWLNSDDVDPAIVYSAKYHAKFDYPEEISVAVANTWLDDDFYREAVISIAIPTINLHMYSQLDIMGISTNARPLGMASNLISQKIPAKRRAARKTALIPPKE